MTWGYCAAGGAEGEGGVFGESPLSDAGSTTFGLAGGVGGVCRDAMRTAFSPWEADSSRPGGAGASAGAG